ncbi:hypothetical protein [Rubrimonas cliftonensis]|uniref:Predicted 5' DNA nuclease, flap endonuclease-1-like, helix-3-turn-helix (H3TH) domain n=1 Tax=Rubrimonas cliftonensis TaxID=89524 RepID=A0A1H3YKM6_9RHOB|nr:hypothetical protein [Rubrimonas cliftonensis]SEA11574.1 Predicted 5' DNA nuclease, flap endonuclease-1-like, helix-3-turn-helix (H3TH) domain [Rubrimonas cliftonensis]
MLAPKRNENPLQYWISLFPTAPLFGVPWRFEAMMPGAQFFRPSDVVAQMTRASARESAETVERATEVAASQVREAAEVIEHVAQDVKQSARAGMHAATTTDARAIEPAIETAEQTAETFEAAAEATADAAETAFDATTDAVETAAEAAADAVETAAASVAPATLFASAPEEVDDLKQIKGVGPKLEAMLNDMGIYRLDQIAAMSPRNLAWVDENLTAFKGRPLRDDWVSQAKALL